MLFVLFELQSYSVYSQEAACFGEKLDLPARGDNLGSVHAQGAHFLKEWNPLQGHIVLYSM